MVPPLLKHSQKETLSPNEAIEILCQELYSAAEPLSIGAKAGDAAERGMGYQAVHACLVDMATLAVGNDPVINAALTAAMLAPLQPITAKELQHINPDDESAGDEGGNIGVHGDGDGAEGGGTLYETLLRLAQVPDARVRKAAGYVLVACFGGNEKLAAYVTSTSNTHKCVNVFAHSPHIQCRIMQVFPHHQARKHLQYTHPLSHSRTSKSSLWG